MWLLGDVEAVTADIRTRDRPLPELRRDRSGHDPLQERRDGDHLRGLGGAGEPVGLLVAGTEGHAAMFNDRLYLRTQEGPGRGRRAPVGKTARPARTTRCLQFVSAIAGQKDLPLVTPREAAARVKVMEACTSRRGERKWVTVG